MKTYIVLAVASVALLAGPPVASSKGQIVKLVVESDDLPAALEITDPAVVDRFDIWWGPGVRVNEEPVHLNRDDPGPSFIDWFEGATAERPPGLLQYEVTFVIGGRVSGEYVVLHEFNPSVSAVIGRNDEATSKHRITTGCSGS